MAKGATWMVGFKLLEKSIGLISTVILARILIPEDFGLVAMAMIVVAFIELMRAFNFDIVLIQNQQATKDHYNTVWSLNVIAAIFIAALMVASAPVVVSFYSDPRLESIMYVLAAGVAFSGFENVGVVAFRKELTFHKEFAYLLGKKLIGFFTSISLALYMGNYWALIGGMVATRLGVVLLSYIVHNYRPRFCLTKGRELFGFSYWLLINNTLFFANSKAPEIIIGKLLGSSSLGIYSIAYEISNIPTTEMVAPINRAVFPGYSKLSNSLEDLRESYLNTIAYIATLALPAALGLAAISPVFIPVVLGDKWEQAIPIMQIIAIAGAFSALQTNSGSVYLALGKPKLLSLITIFRISIFIPTVYIFCERDGLQGIAWATLLLAMIMAPIGIYVLKNVIELKIKSFISSIIRPATASIIMALIIHHTIKYSSQYAHQNNSLLWLVFCIFLGAILYGSTLLFFWYISGKPEGPEKTILKLITNKLEAIKGSTTTD